MPVVISGAATPTNVATVAWQTRTVTVTSSSAVAGYPAINLTDPATWSSWKPSSVGGWAAYEFTGATQINTVGIAAHNMGSSGASFDIQGSSDGTSWATQVSYSPLTDEDILLLFPTTTFRHWRIRMNGNTANVGVLVLTLRVSFPHTPIDSYTPLHHARKYDKMFNDSIKGAMLGNRVMASGAETEVDFGFVPRLFVESSLLTFESHYNQGGMFFYASWPAGLPKDIGYCRTNSEDGTIQIEFIEGENLASLSFGIHAYAG